MRLRRPRSGWRRLLFGAVIGAVCVVNPAARAGDDSAALRERFATLDEPAKSGATWPIPLNPFGLPIYLLSSESADRIEGEVYARIDHPFEDLRRALARSEHWCEILILHPNVKYCRAAPARSGEVLFVGIGRKTFQALGDAYWLRFDFRANAATADPLRVELRAPTGPLSTSDYRLSVEATALSAGASVMHLSYGYSFGAIGRLAMQTYLGTLGRDKVGFSITSRDPGGRPIYIGGMRGVVERNAMRYFLAIDVHQSTCIMNGPRAMHTCLRLWFEASERYARQLHELDRAEYLDMKVRELWRQQTIVFQPASD